ncbi:hypothetical protein [Paenibacillus polymyxa]|uniref:hypothetical protein n=1 Tax=Paenibacillus polymyxa TaxID=1406 RepID=UPI00298C6EC1|nr:hypothetical protein [Paenibacillus polymyxa]
MTDKPRNWQEDMKLCQKATDGLDMIRGEKQVFTQCGFEDQRVADFEKEDDAIFMIEAREALPYWLQQYAALEREYERFQKAARGWNDDLTKAEAEIERKDAEIAELKRLAEFWESQYSDASTHGDETEERLNAEINRLNSLLQDVGNTP